MKFLIDAQLPSRLARWIDARGHEAVHTTDLPEGNRTDDAVLNERSVHDQSALVTKDEDFVDTFLLRRQPHKLLLVTTGNIGNRELERLFEDNLELIAQAFETSDFIELDRTSLIIHQ